MRSSGPLRLSGYGGGRCWRLVGVAEGRETPKGRGASGGGRTGGGRGVPKTARAAAGTSKTPRRSPRPTGTSGSASYGRGRTAAGRTGQEPRAGRGGVARDDATGDGARRGPRTPAADSPRRTARPPAPDGTRRTARPPAADGTRRTSRPPAAESARRTARPAASDGTRRTARPAAAEGSRGDTADGTRRTARPPATEGARRAARPPAREGSRPAAGRSFGTGTRSTGTRGTGTQGTGPGTRTFHRTAPRRTDEGPAGESAGFERGPGRPRAAFGGSPRETLSKAPSRNARGVRRLADRGEDQILGCGAGDATGAGEQRIAPSGRGRSSALTRRVCA